MSGPLVKTLTVNAVNTLLADYLTSVFQWEAGRVVVPLKELVKAFDAKLSWDPADGITAVI